MKQLPLAALGAVLLVGSVGQATAATLPDNDRLVGIRLALQDLLDAADRQSVPADVLVSKVREGLAKGVAPDRLLATVRALARSLERAQRVIRAGGRSSPPPVLVRTLAEAEAAGVDLELTRALVQSSANDGDVVRAVDALTELTLRGYPGRPTATVVDQVLRADPGAVGRMVAGLEQLRASSSLNRIDTVDSLGRSLALASTFDEALKRSLDAGGRASGRGDNRSSREDGAGSARRLRDHHGH